MATERPGLMVPIVVLDASVSAAWVFDDENSPYADVVFTLVHTNDVLVPSFWRFEIRNALLSATRRNRIDHDQAMQYLATLSTQPIRTDDQSDFATAYDLARFYNLSFYDAVYLETARRNNASLATLDRGLTRAANAEGVFLVV